MDFSSNFKDLIDNINDYIKRVHSDNLTDEEREEIKKEMLKIIWTDDGKDGKFCDEDIKKLLYKM
jgi:hypothetical protein